MLAFSQKIALFIFFSFNLWAQECQLKQPIVVLSGPFALILDQLDLIKSKQVVGISSYALGVDPQKYQIYSDKIMAQGLYLSDKNFQQIKDKYQSIVVLADEGKDFKRFFENKSWVQVLYLKTRSLDPFAAFNLTLEKLGAYLVGCDQKLAEIKEEVQKVQVELTQMQAMAKNQRVIFFLGEIKKQDDLLQMPAWVMLDGPVLSLLSHKKITSYDSNLAYLTPSSKIIDRYQQEGLVTLIGLESSPKQKLLQNYIHNKTKVINIYDSQGTIPGLGQVRLLKKIIELLSLP